MPAPSFDLTINGSGGGQYTTDVLLETGINAVVEALYARASGIAGKGAEAQLVSVAGANAITAALPDEWGDVPVAPGLRVLLAPVADSAGSVTLNVGGSGAKPVTGPDGGILRDGFFRRGKYYRLRLTGSGGARWEVMEESVSPVDYTTAAHASWLTTLTAVSGTNTLTATLPATYPGALAPPSKLVLIPATTNTGAVTLSVNGGPARPVRDASDRPLIAGELVAGRSYLIRAAGSGITHYRLVGWLSPRDIAEISAAVSAAFAAIAAEAGTRAANDTAEREAREADVAALQASVDAIVSAASAAIPGPYADAAAAIADGVADEGYYLQLRIDGGIDLYQINGTAGVFVQEWTRVRDFASRAALVSARAAGLILPAGTPVTAEGLDWQFRTGATGISDLPGMEPAGPLMARHFPALAGGITYAQAKDAVMEVNAGETIRIPTDAPDLQTALDHIVTRGNRRWTILIEDGHLLTRSLICDGEFGHVTIQSEAEGVSLAPGFVHADAGVMSVLSGTAPVWDALVDCGGQVIGTGDMGALTYREGSRGIIRPGRGARNAGSGSGLFVASLASVYADRGVFSGFPAYGAWVTHMGSAYLERINLSDNGTCGLFLSRLGSAYTVGGKFVGNPVGARVWRSHLVAFPHGAGPTEFVGTGDTGRGIEANHGAQIEIHERSGHSVEISNFTHGIDAAGVSRVNCQGGSLSGIVYDGIRANGAGTVVNADGTVIACGRNPVVADNDALVSINDGSAVGAAAVVFWAKNGGRIRARRTMATGCTSTVATVLCETAGDVDVSGADLTGGAAVTMLSRDGSRVIAKGTQARRGETDAAEDMIIETGSTIIAHGATGGTITAPNVLTERGIIYR